MNRTPARIGHQEALERGSTDYRVSRDESAALLKHNILVLHSRGRSPARIAKALRCEQTFVVETINEAERGKYAETGR